jgi:hypothetical protein
MKTLQFLLLYYWLKLQLFRPRKVKREVSLSRKDREAMGLITTKLKELPNFSTMSDGEKNAFLFLGLIIGFGLLKSISMISGSAGRNELPPFVERLFSLLLKEEDLECMLGDLHEEYQEKLKTLDVVRAKVWLYWQIFNSAWSLACEAARVKLYSWLRQGIR